ncbi:MAG: ATP-binding protein [Lachnospiraceae bacterium]|nr:ATP-binding protein [Lachnospiraceae bacterium]
MKEITVDATIDNVQTITDFVDERLEEMNCPVKAQMQIDIVIDELCSNVARYAYSDRTGKVTVSVDTVDKPMKVWLTFTDEGVPYNPLAKEDPDITLSAEERKLGGLGIYMVKKMMDEFRYEYKDGKNIVTVCKVIEG